VPCSVVSGPGDVVVGRAGTDSSTSRGRRHHHQAVSSGARPERKAVLLLGDNHSAAIYSRTFGPVLGDAIFAKVFAVDWPLRDITFRLGQSSGAPPGAIDCN
jgi:hypothetical protein